MRARRLHDHQEDDHEKQHTEKCTQTSRASDEAHNFGWRRPDWRWKSACSRSDELSARWQGRVPRVRCRQQPSRAQEQQSRRDCERSLYLRSISTQRRSGALTTPAVQPAASRYVDSARAQISCAAACSPRASDDWKDEGWTEGYNGGEDVQKEPEDDPLHVSKSKNMRPNRTECGDDDVGLRMLQDRDAHGTTTSALILANTAGS